MTWEHALIPEIIIEKQNTNFIICELTNGHELFEETLALKHCVFSYTNYCASGFMRIYSLRKIAGFEQIPILTLEIRDNCITQAAGKSNRLPNEEEMQIIEEWAIENDVEFEK